MKMQDNSKYFTFLVIYKNPFKPGITTSASFCEKTEIDAIAAFDSYCRSRGMTPRPGILGLTLIYSRTDHSTYGELYGFPEEYVA